MSSFEEPTGTEKGWLASPMPLLLSGVATVVLGWLCSSLAAHGAVWQILSFMLLFGGLVATGVAVARRPASPAILGLASAGALAASFAFDVHHLAWDSAVLLLRILTVVAALSAGIVMLPRTGRRVVVSLLILLHFGGIITAVTAAQPQMWLALEVWTYFYRPYLQFMYLNNAYHFYSPEPGPAHVFWFCVEYERGPDGKKNYRWVKIPDFDPKDPGRRLRPDHTTLWPNVEYTRRLSLAENASMPGPPLRDESKWQRRLAAGQIKNIPPLPVEIIPGLSQYREPGAGAKRWISSYVRHVARHYKHETKPELAVIGVKVYGVVHNLILPGQLVEGIDPYDPTQYIPFYQGEFDKDGNLLNPDDPFLYWIIPIFRPRPPGALFDEHTFRPPGPLSANGKPIPAQNYVLLHADVEEEGLIP